MLPEAMRNSFLILGVISALAVTLFTACDKPQKDSDIISVGDTLPHFEVTDNTGRTITNDSLRGHTSVVVLFHTGCGDCRYELPSLDSLYRNHASDPDFRLLCISRAQTEADVAAYWQEAGFAMPYSAQEDRSVYDLFAHSRIPRVFISNSKTTVIFSHTDRDMQTTKALEAEVAAVK